MDEIQVVADAVEVLDVVLDTVSWAVRDTLVVMLFVTVAHEVSVADTVALVVMLFVAVTHEVSVTDAVAEGDEVSEDNDEAELDTLDEVQEDGDELGESVQ